ncbi:cyclase family protein [Anaerotignum sp.]|nr:cyclase family protein [Anaerotignum sp.]MBQ7759196.1 cyclase family protein [Anaerotignum sp.]
MKVIDLTQMISNDMPVFPGTAPARLEAANTIEKDHFRETMFHITSHTGTHMDAPSHLFEEGTMLDELPAEQFVGKALVIDCRDLKAGDIIGMERVEAVGELADQADFLLFNTGWDVNWDKADYFGDYPVVSMEICQYALESGKKGLGFDTIGIDPVSDMLLPRHRKLLGNRDIVIIENLTNLDKIGGGLFTFVALPLKYKDADGAPTRAVAILED